MKATQEARFAELRHKMENTEQEVATMLEQFRKEFAETAAAARTERKERIDVLRAEVQQISSEVAATLKQFRNELADAAARGREERPKAVLEAEAFMENLRRDMAAIKREMTEQRQQLQQQAKEERIAFLRDVRLSVEGILKEARTARAEHRTELDETRREWNEKRGGATGSPVAKPQPNPAQASKKAAASTAGTDEGNSQDAVNRTAFVGGDGAQNDHEATAKPVDSQKESKVNADVAANVLRQKKDADTANRPAEALATGTSELAHIEGIGPRMAALLHNAGYTTLADLAEATPEDVKEKVGELPAFADVPAWIRQAQERTS